MSEPGTQQSLRTEADVYARYFLHHDPIGRVADIYASAMQKLPVSDMPKDLALLRFAVKHPWSIGLLDGGLVFIDPQSEFRRRLYVMFAILEAQPEYADLFLPRQRSIFYLPVLAGFGIRAVTRALLGMVLVKAVR